MLHVFPKFISARDFRMQQLSVVSVCSVSQLRAYAMLFYWLYENIVLNSPSLS
jgi:hypothetical protein